MTNSIDVIIPVRGNNVWLEECLVSLVKQTLQADCITLVDDGVENKDKLKGQCDSILGGGYVILQNRWEGISDAINTGVINSKCTLIARMDSDDIAHPERFEKQVEFMDNAPDYILGCGTQAEYINEAGKTLGMSNNPVEWAEIKLVMVRRSCFVHPSLMLRRTALLSTPYRREFDGAEDIDLLLRMSEHGQVINLEKALLRYRFHTDQASFKNRSRQVALQELAFRTHKIRTSGSPDPVEYQPMIVEEFVAWRLSVPAYSETRKLLTILRYISLFLRGGSFRECMVLLKAIPQNIKISLNSIKFILKIILKSGGSLADEKTPFSSINPKALKRDKYC